MESGTLSEKRNPDGNEYIVYIEMVRLAFPSVYPFTDRICYRPCKVALCPQTSYRWSQICSQAKLLINKRGIGEIRFLF